MEHSTLSSTTGAAIGWQAPIISSDFKSIKRFKVFKRIGYQAHQISNVFRDCLAFLGHIRLWGIDEDCFGGVGKSHGACECKGFPIENGLWEFSRTPLALAQDCFQFSGSLVLLGPGPARGAGAGYWCGTPAPAPRCTILHHATSSCTREKYHHTPEKQLWCSSGARLPRAPALGSCHGKQAEAPAAGQNP